MMKINQGTQIVARGEDGETLRLMYSNRGEPYREGCDVQVTISNGEYAEPEISVFIDHRELVSFRDALNAEKV